MAEEIRPALTAEEWARYFAETAHALAHSTDDPDRVRRRQRQEFVFDRVPEGSTPSEEEFRQAAAFALLGYFTWAHVDALRTMAKAEEWAISVGDNGRTGMDPDEARALADRIAALLPPRS